MGHRHSKSDSSGSSDGSDSSRFPRFRRRIHLHRRRKSSNSSGQRTKIAVKDFVGIARIQLIEAEMKFRDRWFACISMGERTYRTVKSD